MNQDLKINLIDGNFNAQDALDIISSVLDKKMNYHKLQRLAKTEKDHSNPCSFENDRIAALQAEKDKAIAFFAPFLKEDISFEIHSGIEIQKK